MENAVCLCCLWSCSCDAACVTILVVPLLLLSARPNLLHEWIHILALLKEALNSICFHKMPELLPCVLLNLAFICIIIGIALCLRNPAVILECPPHTSPPFPFEWTCVYPSSVPV
jgi:hypothetical protein